MRIRDIEGICCFLGVTIGVGSLQGVCGLLCGGDGMWCEIENRVKRESAPVARETPLCLV